MASDSDPRYTLCEIKDGATAAPVETKAAVPAAPVTGRPGGRRRTRHRRQWLISPEGFRELRHSCLLSNRKAAAAYLGVCVRTIRHWDAGRCRVPWAAVRLLRLLRAGELGGLLDGWEGWTIYRDRLVSPDGRAYLERDMRRLWLTLTQAALFREAYDRETRGDASTDLTPAVEPLRVAGAAALVQGGAEGVERPSLSRRRRLATPRTPIRETASPLAGATPLPCRTALRGPHAGNLDVTDRVMHMGGSRADGARPARSGAAAATGLVLFVNNGHVLGPENDFLQPPPGASLPCAGTDFSASGNARFATRDNPPNNAAAGRTDNGQ